MHPDGESLLSGGAEADIAAWARKSARKLFGLDAARRDAGNSLLKVEERP